jgi:hypothetical protein
MCKHSPRFLNMFQFRTLSGMSFVFVQKQSQLVHVDAPKVENVPAAHMTMQFELRFQVELCLSARDLLRNSLALAGGLLWVGGRETALATCFAIRSL